MNAYCLVARGIRIQGLRSDREFALRNGLHPQNIVDWKAGKSMPGWDKLEKLAAANQMEVWEAVKYIQENTVQFKEAGFANIEVMAGIAGMSLLTVTPTPEAAIGAGLIALSTSLYIMRSQEGIGSNCSLLRRRFFSFAPKGHS